jgi:uncharacterized membrane protein
LGDCHKHDASCGGYHIRYQVGIVIGFVLVFGHNLLDAIHIDNFFWALLHDPAVFQLNESRFIRVTYPVLPWIGIMILGFNFGRLYTNKFTADRRRKWLLIIGTVSILLFIVVRLLNIYGDPQPWSVQSSAGFTILSFINTTKYPPSMLYTLMTLGPAMIFLACAENISGNLTRAIIHIGRVPMFFYLLHLYLIHIIALFAAEVSGFKWTDMILQRRVWLDPQLKGYGFSLTVTYLIWIGVILILYPFCKWYDKYKTDHKQYWWLSYL